MDNSENGENSGISASPDPAVAMQQLMQAGQAAAQWMASRAGPLAADGDAANPLASLQQEWLSRHAALWQAMLVRRGGQSSDPIILPEPADRRFADSAWSESPIYDYLRRCYLINAEFFLRAADMMPVDDARQKERVKFLARQYVDALSPANFAATNPEFIRTALDSKGESIQRGILNLLADLEKGHISTTDETAYSVGGNVAVTPGSVVFENDLIQLIEYAPTTSTVGRTPLLVVPPCINKYYILDLQPANSFVRYAVGEGRRVFLISWRNVKDDLGYLSWDDYLESGVLKAIRVVCEICRVRQLNALGFCIGGTLLCSALAVARARGEDTVKSLTLLTTLLDFEDAGDLACFVDPASLAAREQGIGRGGIFPGREFSAVFSALRPNDLIWQYVVRNYLNGGQAPAFDLLFWNADSTNVPGPFLVWYLRNMYLDNRLREPGALQMCGTPVDLGALRMPMFIFATREDHIVPWHAAYRSMKLLGGDKTFVLGASGHVAGVINPAQSNKRNHWVADRAPKDAADWLASAREVQGSWWPSWSAWLKSHSGRAVAAPERPGSGQYPPLEPAPGRYVRERA